MPKNKPLAKVLHFDSFGKRQEKYNRLENSSVNSVEWKELDLKEPYYFFVPKDFAAEEKYMKGFSINEIFKENNSGIQTKRDKLTIQFDEKDLVQIQEDFRILSNEELAQKYNIAKDGRDWTIDFARKDLQENSPQLKKVIYKPFDYRNTLYTGKSKGFLAYPRHAQSKHMLKDNFCLFTTRTIPTNSDFNRIFIGKNISDIHVISDQTYFFPLYLYNTERETLLDEGIPDRTPNFDMEIIGEIEKKLGMKLAASFLGEQRKEFKIGIETFSPENLLDYIYAVLHSKSYRETYKEFLKIDFPRVSFDVTKQVFHNMVELGQELRSWHLLENEKLTPNNFITEYPQDGDNLVEKIRFEPLSFSKGQVKEGAKGLSGSGSGAEDSGVDSRKDNELGKVFINDTQYFGGVPETVWEFYIGGYQPAQKWLKDRKGRSLSYEDIVHYGKIILTLSETIRIMQEIEEVFEV